MSAPVVVGVEPITGWTRDRFRRACSLLGAQPVLVRTEAAIAATTSSGDAQIAVPALDDPAAQEAQRPDGTVVAVVPLSEFAVPLANVLASRWGTYHDPVGNAALYRKKHVMRQRVTQLGLPQPQLIQTAHQSEIDSIRWEELDYPVVVKPAEAAGSVNVGICSDPQSARALAERIKGFDRSRVTDVTFEPRVLVEKYVGGREFSAEVVVEDGVAEVVATTHKFTAGPPSPVEVAHMVDGSARPPAAVVDMVTRLVDGWQVANGVLHVEYKLQDGVPYFIEAAVRIAGDRIPQVVEAASGTNLEACQIAARSSGALLRPDRPNDGGRCVLVRFLHSNRDLDLLQDVSGVRVLEAHGKERTASINTGTIDFKGRAGYEVVEVPAAAVATVVSLLDGWSASL